MMRRLDGNSILIVEDDRGLCEELRLTFFEAGAQVTTVHNVTDALQSLTIYDFDIVLCGYYLPDGLIHHVIDWSRENLKFLPVFAALGNGFPGDENLLQRHLISCVFSRKDDKEKIIKGIQSFLFDFGKFYQDLLAMVEPRGINMELIVGGRPLPVSPIEIMGEGIFVAVNESFDVGTFALLRVSLYEEVNIENFALIGCLGGRIPGGQLFRVNESYAGTWHKLLERLEDRQEDISGYLSKVAGK